MTRGGPINAGNVWGYEARPQSRLSGDLLTVESRRNWDSELNIASNRTSSLLRHLTTYGATLCYMTTITHRELRNNSAEILRRVEAGETLQVTNNGTPAAVIGPADGATLDDLISQGHARPARADAATLDRLRGRLSGRTPSAKTTSEMVEDVRGRW